LRNYNTMNFFIFIVSISSLLLVFILSEDSWRSFSVDFPNFTNATVGPYFIILGSIIYAFAVRGAFIISNQTKNFNKKFDPLSFVGLQMTAIAIVFVSFFYSFNVVNSNIQLKYYLLFLILSTASLFGLMSFIVGVKQIDSDSLFSDANLLDSTFQVKKLLHDMKNRLQDKSELDYLDQKLMILNDLIKKRNSAALYEFYDEIINWASERDQLKNDVQRLQLHLKDFKNEVY